MKLWTMGLLIATGILLTAGGAAAGTPEQDKISACNTEAAQKQLKGYDRSQFLKACAASGTPVPPNARQEKIAACDKDAAAKELKGPERKAFMRACLAKK